MPITDEVVYANVWEDPELNRRSLHVRPGDSVLSITSGGCNSLCLLLENPGRVVSIDLNPAQLGMLEYKRAAIMELDYDDYLESLGVTFYGKPSRHPQEYRVQLFDRIKKHMSPEARSFWEGRRERIAKGIFMDGKVEKFFAIYRRMLKFFYDWSDIEKLFSFETLEEQRNYYIGMNRRKWKFLNQCLLNKFVLSLVKGSHSFEQVEDPDLAANLNRKIHRGMTRFFNPDNYFMSLMLLGEHYKPDAMSPYLLRENFPVLKENIGRLEIFKGVLTDVLAKYGKASFDRLQLSNIFEWMTNEFFNGVIREAIDLARPHARFCWRYTLARPRALDAENSKRLRPEPDLAQKLFEQDRSFIYESFHVYQLVS